ncbi:MAG: hypothetical protein HN802_02675 [Candidatus Jacksonbacteria bacterium]|jgi:hypothetical protein|nr:hypothetical protein [Candidatus Jacksonbacteria bacterium]
MKVKYIDCTDQQVSYRGHSDPRNLLKQNKVYEVARWDEFPWHTDVTLVGIIGRFNSVCFEKIGVKRGK